MKVKDIFVLVFFFISLNDVSVSIIAQIFQFTSYLCAILYQV